MRCAVCRALTNERLFRRDVEKRWLFFRWRGLVEWPLCRAHLVERLRAHFVATDQRVVVFCPDRDKRWAHQYSYHTTEEVQQMCNVAGPDSVVPDKVRSWLAAITGSCHRCGGAGQVAFFPAAALSWEQVPRMAGVLYDHPLVRDVTADLEILCRACAADEVCQAIEAASAEDGFGEGVFSPLGCAEGIMLTTMPAP